MRWLATLILCLIACRAEATVITHNVANAPAWAATTTYSTTGHFGNRVLSGPALTPGGSPSYTDGSALYLLELTTAGTSGSSQPTISSCPSTGITDGSAVWKCLVKVDYIDLNSALADEPVAYAANTTTCTGSYATPAGCYFLYEHVYFNKAVWYECAGPTPSGSPICPGSGWPVAGQGYQCASGGTGPTVPGGPNLDGSCAWIKAADVPYSSNHANAQQHYVIFGDPQLGCGGTGCTARTQEATTNHFYMLWGGGSAAPSYPKALLSGHLGNNFFDLQDATQNCSGGDIVEQGFTNCWSYTIEAASGEGVCNWSSGTALAYNASPAVRIDQASDYGMQIVDNGVNLNCLQVRNTSSANPAIGSVANTTNYIDAIHLTNSIVDSGASAPLTIVVDALSIFQNDLIVNRYTGSNAGGIESKYQHSLFNNTIVSLGSSSNSVPFSDDCMSISISFESHGAPSVKDNVFIGWANPAAWKSCFGEPNYAGAATNNNASDLASSVTSGSWTSPWVTGNTMTTSSLSGTSNIYNQVASNTFVNTTTDFRLKAGAPSIAAGASFSPQGTLGNYGYTLYTPDIFGTSRSAVDIGAFETTGSSPPGPGGRRMFR